MKNTVQPAPETATASPDSPAVVVTGAHAGAALRVGDLRPTRKKPGLVNVFLPNRSVTALAMALVMAVEVALALALWIFSPYKVLPQPGEVLSAISRLWLTQGLGQELATSFGLNIQALMWSSLVSLGLAYLTVLPVFRPVVAAISRGRFLSLVGFSLLTLLIFGGGHPQKLAMLVFGISVFYVTSMAAVIAAIPRGEFEHARTLRMSEWRTVWEVVILGTADKAFEVLRQNAAMGWMLLTLVEGIVRNEGGVGLLLDNVSKHMLLAEVYGVQLVILLVGMGQDLLINFLRRIVCPYADLTLERK